MTTSSLHQSEFSDRIERVDQAQWIAAGKQIAAAFEERFAGCLAVEKPLQELAGHFARLQLEDRNLRADHARDVTVENQLANEGR